MTAPRPTEAELQEWVRLAEATDADDETEWPERVRRLLAYVADLKGSRQADFEECCRRLDVIRADYKNRIAALEAAQPKPAAGFDAFFDDFAKRSNVPRYFHGYREDMSACWSAATLTAHPTREEMDALDACRAARDGELSCNTAQRINAWLKLQDICRALPPRTP